MVCMRARSLLGLVGGSAILLFPALGHACDLKLTRSEEIALVTWLLSMVGILFSLLITVVSWLAALPRTRAKIYRILGFVNLFAWAAMLASFNRTLVHPEAWALISPSLILGCGLWLVGSRGSRPRLGVTPGPV